MIQNNKPNCFNRPDYKDHLIVQDGWGWLKIKGLSFKVPIMKTIKNVMSKDCKQNDEGGAAKRYNWDCDCCIHYKVN